jgi:hypothetical protein
MGEGVRVPGGGLRTRRLEALMSRLIEHGLARRLGAPLFTPGGQRVLVGTKSMGDGWVAAIIRLEGRASHDEAAWIGVRTKLI